MQSSMNTISNEHLIEKLLAAAARTVWLAVTEQLGTPEHAQAHRRTESLRKHVLLRLNGSESNG